MRALDWLAPRIYSFVKTNRGLRPLLLPIWRLSSRVGLGLRTSFAKGVNPPAGHYASLSEWLADESDSPASKEAREIYSRGRVSRTDPVTLDPDIHWKLREREREVPAVSVAVVPGGRVWGPGNAIIDHENKVIGEISYAIDMESYIQDVAALPVFREARLPPVHRVSGRIAVLAAPGGGGYYHQMVDVLPRIHLLRKAGIALESIDRFVLNALIARYHHETLQHFGIPRSKIIESHWHPHIGADELVVPSLPGDFGHVPRWACDFLRDEFLGSPPGDQDDGTGERLYLTRSAAAHRRVTNEDEVRQLVRDHDFRVEQLESHAVTEQARMLASASVVCAAHGAALTNLVFCRPGTRVIEFLSPNDVSHVFWTLASQMELPYAYLLGEGGRPPEGVDPHLSMEDIRVDIDSLAELLRRFLG